MIEMGDDNELQKTVDLEEKINEERKNFIR
jgi:hypothetical protein